MDGVPTLPEDFSPCPAQPVPGVQCVFSNTIVYLVTELQNCSMYLLIVPLCKEGGVDRTREQLQGGKAVHLLDSDSTLPLHLDTSRLRIDNATNVANFDIK